MSNKSQLELLKADLLRAMNTKRHDVFLQSLLAVRYGSLLSFPN